MVVLFAVVLLGVIIFVHELGHFTLAKLMNVKVEKFSLGFGRKLAGWKRGETEYVISALPLGGYVKMLGQSDIGEAEEPMSEEDRARSFNSQSVARRAMIVLAGPLFNIVFASVVFFFIFVGGVPSLLPEVGEVLEESPAMRAGLIEGDVIKSIDGAGIEGWSDMTSLIWESAGRPLAIEVQRGDELMSLTITPERKTVKDIFGQDKEIGLIGIKPSGAVFTRKMGLAGALSGSVTRTVEIAGITLISVVKLIQRVIPAETIGGPILIVQMAGQQASEGALSFFNFMAVISITLGVINLFPIPVLDGGHLVFLLVEAVRGKPVSEKTMALAQRIGLVVLVMIMALAVYNDIVRLITGKEMSTP